MLLRRFEAYGFKSFADKVEIEFGKGVTAIVGPNGSGKSNISDAIRWVLGEQNVRNLRGAKTEDIIFSGSSERRPLNVAEVSLIFDNSDNRIPIDFTEVIITRRVYRSGESEYMINKSACRLKDIQDLLGDIGLGRESMAVISQSKVDEVLNSRPEDRRLLFEDAAGITKYKQRKRDALRKLDDTEANITRVADIMAELGNQLQPLAESAARTEQYNSYHGELTACQVSLLQHKIDRAQAMLSDIRNEQESLTDQHIAESTRLSTAEAEAEGLTRELSTIDQQLQLEENDLAIVAADLEKADNRIAVLQERTVQKRLAVERVEQDILQMAEKKNKSHQEYAKLEAELASKRMNITAAESEVSMAEAQLAATLSNIKDKEQELSAANDCIFASLQETSAQRNLGVNLERDLLRYRSRHSQLLKEKAEYTSKLEETQRQCSMFQAEYSEKVNSLSDLATANETLAAKKVIIERDIVGVRSHISQSAGQISQKQSRLTVLSNMQRDLDGFNRGSKSVLTSKAPWRKGICGAVAQVIDVASEYVTAIEVALGGALQDIITEDENTVRSAISYLKQQNAGRVTFLPITTIRPRAPREAETRAAKGAVGIASELVKSDVRYRAIIDHLLGRVIVARNLDQALALAKQFSFSLRIVTLEGELINPGGAITGGSLARRESSYLGRNGEIYGLEQEVTLLTLQHSTLESTLTTMLQQNDAINIQQEQLMDERQKTGVRQAQLAAYCDQAKKEISRLATAVETIKLEIGQCISEETQLEQNLQQTEVMLTRLEQTDAIRKQTISANQSELSNLQQQKEQIVEQATDKKIVLSTIRQEITSLEHLLKSCLSNISDNIARITDLSTERDTVTEEIQQAGKEFTSLSLLRHQLLLQKQQKNEQRCLLLGQKASKLAVLQQAEKDCKDLRRRASTLEARLHELQLMLTRYELETSNSLSQLLDQHCLSLESARGLCRLDDPQTLAAKIRRLEADIACLGSINPAAIDEYARVKDRFAFLEHQQNDLVTAKDQLSLIIGEIDATMGKRFMAAFNAINSHFSGIFPRLFGGGKAQIELSDPGSPLNSGIEIYVQPPGKKQQNLALLSGGERALTVIALLFSLLAFRPAPFSVVDEIDAALDEANVQRFSEFLREFCSNTQFIVVTHRKGTMEVADVMHGVTMEDSGVSRIVSVRFMDKAG